MKKDPRITGLKLPVWHDDDPTLSFYQPKDMLKMISRQRPWRLAPDSKKKTIHELAGSQGALLAIMPEAISVGGPWGKAAAETGKTSMITLPLPFLLLFILIFFIISFGLKDWFVFFMGIVGFWGFAFFSLVQAWFMKRWLCAPQDWPVIFNRKDRTVTYASHREPYFWKFWRMDIPIEYRTESWDDVKVRSYKMLSGTAGGASFHNSYLLGLFWGGAQGDKNQVKDATFIGCQGYFEDETLWMLWEHIRRYMEEDGPAIRQGEKLRQFSGGKPIVYPSDVLKAAGGAPLSAKEVEEMAANHCAAVVSR